jgi:hypothetical protein
VEAADQLTRVWGVGATQTENEDRRLREIAEEKVQVAQLHKVRVRSVIRLM